MARSTSLENQLEELNQSEIGPTAKSQQRDVSDSAQANLLLAFSLSVKQNFSKSTARRSSRVRRSRAGICFPSLIGARSTDLRELAYRGRRLGLLDSRSDHARLPHDRINAP